MPFSDHEVIALVSVIPQKLIQYRDKVIIQLLLDSGIRGGELINLRLKDWTGKSIHIKDGKGGKHRNVSVGITTAEAIDDYIQNYRVHHCDRLFTTQEGTEVKFGNLNDRIKEWQKLSNVEHASSHRFRATFATRFIKDKRGDIEQLRILLGHEDIATTKRYVHLTKEEEAQYANSHNSLVDQITRSPKNITEHGNTNLNTETDDNG